VCLQPPPQRLSGTSSGFPMRLFVYHFSFLGPCQLPVHPPHGLVFPGWCSSPGFPPSSPRSVTAFLPHISELVVLFSPPCSAPVQRFGFFTVARSRLTFPLTPLMTHCALDVLMNLPADSCVLRLLFGWTLLPYSVLCASRTLVPIFGTPWVPQDHSQGKSPSPSFPHRHSFILGPSFGS